MRLPPVYGIVDADLAARAGSDPVALAEAYLRGGLRCLQLRAKQASSATLLAWAQAIVDLARTAGATLIVNDRADIAAIVGAGLHVGQQDLPVAEARALLGDEACVGLSTHSLEQFDQGLREPASYLAVGPVYRTRTKDTGYDAVGLALVRAAAARARGRMPVVAIGGITLDVAPDVLAAGAASVAVITDLMGTDPEVRARQWTERLQTA